MTLIGVEEILMSLVSGLSLAAVVFTGAFVLGVLTERKPR